jgi:acetoin utilization deacetylase AcuC-like enzyme
MKVIFRDDFYPAYTRHRAAESGRMEAVMGVIQSQVELVKAEPASEKDLLAVHTKSHVETVKGMRL